jgi:acyl-coenzyme A synthetase/AMP-(fatty) acid ligase
MTMTTTGIAPNGPRLLERLAHDTATRDRVISDGCQSIVPDDVLIVDTLPQLARGKINRPALRELVARSGR